MFEYRACGINEWFLMLFSAFREKFWILMVTSPWSMKNFQLSICSAFRPLDNDEWPYIILLILNNCFWLAENDKNQYHPLNHESMPWYMEVCNGWYCYEIPKNIECAEFIRWAFEYTKYKCKRNFFLDLDCFKTKCNVDDVFYLTFSEYN